MNKLLDTFQFEISRQSFLQFLTNAFCIELFKIAFEYLKKNLIFLCHWEQPLIFKIWYIVVTEVRLWCITEPAMKTSLIVILLICCIYTYFLNKSTRIAASHNFHICWKPWWFKRHKTVAFDLQFNFPIVIKLLAIKCVSNCNWHHLISSTLIPWNLTSIQINQRTHPFMDLKSLPIR